MFTLAQRAAASSLRALRHRISLHLVVGFQPLLLLQMLGGLSQAVTQSVSHTQALARTLLLSGQQRLRDLVAAAPHLRLSLERVLSPNHSLGTDSEAEEAAVQALLEMCLGLILEWIARISRRPHFFALPSLHIRRRILPRYRSSFPTFYPLKARLCISAHPA